MKASSGSSGAANTKSQQETQQHMYGSVLPDVEKSSDHAVPSESTGCKPSYGQQLLSGVQLIAALSVATYVGVAARIYLFLLAKWSGFSDFASLYAQLVGCAILGILSANKQTLMSNHKTFYTALGTGMCGSITTFSTWNVEGAFSLLQMNRTSLTLLPMPDNTSRAITFLTIMIVGLGAPLAVLKFGINVGSSAPFKYIQTKVSCQSSAAPATVAIVIVWILTTGAIVAGCLVFRNYEIMFSLILGTVGTWTRWLLSFLDNKLRGFPAGTFTANVCGTWIIGVVLAAQGYNDNDNELVLSLLSGLVTGLCGCLTTVSTFVGQLNTLPFSMGCLYAFVSIIAAQAGLLPILATYLYI